MVNNNQQETLFFCINRENKSKIHSVLRF